VMRTLVRHLPRLGLLVTLPALLACSSQQLTVDETWFNVAASASGLGPYGGSGCAFYKSGLIELWDYSCTRQWSQLSRDELQTVKELVQSEEWTSGLAWVESQGEDWACCDRGTVAIWFCGEGGGTYVMPISDYEIVPRDDGAPLVYSAPGIPESLRPGLHVLDRILERHFGAHWSDLGQALERQDQPKELLGTKDGSEL